MAGTQSKGRILCCTARSALAAFVLLVAACKRTTPAPAEVAPDRAVASAPSAAPTSSASEPAQAGASATSSQPTAATGPARFVETLDVSVFQKGNLHTHTARSDGDRPPEESYAWYRAHGYAFLALTDHNQLTPPEDVQTFQRPDFVVLRGEEITMLVHGHPVHMNALCTATTVGTLPDHGLENFPSFDAALRWAVARVQEQGGVAMVNHPNFIWALTAEDLPSAHGAQLLEIWSGHPYVRSDGDEQHPSEETIWDRVLAKGETFAGVAVDDTHYIRPHKDPAARPGRGWVQVFASERTSAAICSALAKGHLYSSSGAELRRIVVNRDTLTLWPEGAGARVDFIGEGGHVLAHAQPAQGAAASYRLQGGERFVRARTTLPNGKHAWTPAFRVAREAEP